MSAPTAGPRRKSLSALRAISPPEIAAPSMPAPARSTEDGQHDDREQHDVVHSGLDPERHARPLGHVARAQHGRSSTGSVERERGAEDGGGRDRDLE